MPLGSVADFGSFAAPDGAGSTVPVEAEVSRAAEVAAGSGVALGATVAVGADVALGATVALGSTGALDSLEGEDCAFVDGSDCGAPAFAS